MDMAEVDKVGVGNGGNYKHKTVERLLFKNLNGSGSYLTSEARQVFI